MQPTIYEINFNQAVYSNQELFTLLNLHFTEEYFSKNIDFFRYFFVFFFFISQE